MRECTENVHLNYTKQVENEVKYQKELNRSILSLNKETRGPADNERTEHAANFEM